MRLRLSCIGVLLMLGLSAFAVTYDSQGATTEQSVQTRLGVSFSKKWDNGLKLSLSEHVRFSLYDTKTGMSAKQVAIDTTYAAAFTKSYTTLSLSYAHPEFPYLKGDAGYTLRLLGNKGWSDPSKFLRHRVFFGLTGSYKMCYAKIYLRERFLCDIRTDSINALERNAATWLLRSRIGSDFYIFSRQNVKPYVWLEVENTLNAPEYMQKDGQQFINHVRTQVGVKWRVSKRSSFDFYYRFTYGYNRDINITKKKGKIELTEETMYQNLFGISYNFEW